MKVTFLKDHDGNLWLFGARNIFVRPCAERIDSAVKFTKLNQFCYQTKSEVMHELDSYKST